MLKNLISNACKFSPHDDSSKVLVVLAPEYWLRETLWAAMAKPRNADRGSRDDACTRQREPRWMDRFSARAHAVANEDSRAGPLSDTGGEGGDTICGICDPLLIAGDKGAAWQLEWSDGKAGRPTVDGNDVTGDLRTLPSSLPDPATRAGTKAATPSGTSQLPKQDNQNSASRLIDSSKQLRSQLSGSRTAGGSVTVALDCALQCPQEEIAATAAAAESGNGGNSAASIDKRTRPCAANCKLGDILPPALLSHNHGHVSPADRDSQIIASAADWREKEQQEWPSTGRAAGLGIIVCDKGSGIAQ